MATMSRASLAATGESDGSLHLLYACGRGAASGAGDRPARTIKPPKCSVGKFRR